MWNAGTLLGSRLVRAGLGWAGTVVIVRSLSIEEFGRFTLVFTVLGLMALVTDLGIGRQAVREMSRPGSSHSAFFGGYLGLRIALGLAGYALAVAVVAVAGYPASVVEATAVAAVVVLLATPSSALQVVFQSRMQLGPVAASETAGNLAQVALTAAIAAVGGSLLLFVLPAVLYEMVVLASRWRLARGLVLVRPRVDLGLWRAMLREALPLSVGLGMAVLYTRVDSMMLSKLAGFESVAIYGVSYKFIDVLHFASTAVTVPLLTLLVRRWPDEPAMFRADLQRAATALALVGGSGLLVLLLSAEPLTATLYGDAYAAGADTTRVLAVAEMLVFATSLAVCALVAAGRHRSFPLIMAAGLVLNIVLNLVLIPSHGFFGAGIATLASNLMVAVLMWRGVLGLVDGPYVAVRDLAICGLALAGGLLADELVEMWTPWWLATTTAMATYAALAVITGLVRRVVTGSPSPAHRRGPS